MMISRSALLCIGLVNFLAVPATAGGLSREDLNAALAELEALKKIQAETDARIQKLEAALAVETEVIRASKTTPVTLEAAVSDTQIAEQISSATDGLNLTADMMLRFEGNYSGTGPGRERGVMRSRLGATYQIDPRLKVGALLETGDPDDPNSGYLTFDEFADDFDVSLSRAFLEYQLGAVSLIGGKFVRPFKSTDLLWDSDVNPMGVAARSQIDIGSASTLKLSGIFSVVDENVNGADSHMLGGQASLATTLGDSLEFSAALGFFDYTLGSISGADVGDFRSNLRDEAGGYLSDYDLLDLILSAEWAGLSEDWPVELTLDYVQNLGSAADDDIAIGLDVKFGPSKRPGDLRYAYGYSEAGVDSVLAAFSHDNYAIATNYMAHEFGLHFLVTEQLWLSGSIYHYKPLSVRYSSDLAASEWLNRVRLNLGVTF